MTGPFPRRLRSCVELWPGCDEGLYDPRCCRWPKSCSCTVYDPERVTDDIIRETETHSHRQTP